MESTIETVERIQSRLNLRNFGDKVLFSVNVKGTSFSQSEGSPKFMYVGNGEEQVLRSNMTFFFGFLAKEMATTATISRSW